MVNYFKGQIQFNKSLINCLIVFLVTYYLVIYYLKLLFLNQKLVIQYF